MSFSNPTQKNPAELFIQWKGGEGKLTYWSKEQEENIEVKMPVSFVVLDTLSTITGFSNSHQSGIWSNEVRNVTTDKLVVKTAKGTLARGLYGRISGDLKSQGGKYAQSVYILLKDADGEFKLANIKLSGAALSPWIEFCKKYNIEKCAVTITGSKKAKKGNVEYFTPEFEAVPISDNAKKLAKETDKKLQNYLNIYMSKPLDESDDVEIDNEDISIEDAEEPIETSNDDGDGSIPLEGIPF